MLTGLAVATTINQTATTESFADVRLVMRAPVVARRTGFCPGYNGTCIWIDATNPGFDYRWDCCFVIVITTTRRAGVVAAEDEVIALAAVVAAVSRRVGSITGAWIFVALDTISSEL